MVDSVKRPYVPINNAPNSLNENEIRYIYSSCFLFSCFLSMSTELQICMQMYDHLKKFKQSLYLNQ